MILGRLYFEVPGEWWLAVRVCADYLTGGVCTDVLVLVWRPW